MGAYFIDRLVTWHSQGHAYIATIFFKELFAGNGQVFYAWNSISFKPYAWFHRVFQGFFYYLEHILPCKHCVCYAYFHFSFTLLLSLSLRAFLRFIGAIISKISLGCEALSGLTMTASILLILI